MALEKYRQKRRFDRTTEPKGEGVRSAKPRAGAQIFVVQKHAASHLHYDFRLEMDGALKSWAVPKGPSLDPSVRALAIEVEDHPIEYAGFEGTIPQGEYGGGTVMVWDRGTWESEGGGTGTAAYRAGKMTFELHGDRLRGKWMLVRMGGSSAKPQWLLKKLKDKESRLTSEVDIRNTEQTSVITGRTMEEITAGQRGKRSKGKAASSKSVKKAKKTPTRSARAGVSTPRKTSAIPEIDRLSHALRGPLPRSIEPQLATLVDDAPVGPEWIHEMKFDGYRILAFIEGGRSRLMTRNGLDWTAKFPKLTRTLEALGLESAILDGEVVALNEAGISEFQGLQRAMKAGTDQLAYYVFDLLYLQGFDLRQCPLQERRNALRELLGRALKYKAVSTVRFSEAVEGHGDEVLRNACRLAMEGVVSKRLDAPYSEGRGLAWRKSKCIRRQEMVIGGYTEPEKTRVGFGALLLGYYQGGKLRYAGKVGTGFDVKGLRELHRRLTKLERGRSPFDPMDANERVQGRVHWVKPELVAEIEFTEWTTDGRLRHPVFVALREDKPASEVVRERVSRAQGRASRRTASAPPPTATAGRARKAPKHVPETDTSAVHDVQITHPERIVFEDEGISKLELAQYAEAIAPFALPHLRNRPVVLMRCPRGADATCFYQKDWKETPPKGTHGVEIRESNGTNTYLVIDDAQGLVSLAQFGVLELHSWGCREDDIEHPDRLVFDLDPGPGVPWAQVVEGALLIRTRLKEFKLESFVKTSGGKGLHVVVPLTPDAYWTIAKGFARELAESMSTNQPNRYISTATKAKREGRIFVDYLRNGRGATAVAPYSVRARPGAPVSIPVTWRELTALRRMPKWTLADALVRARRNPWKAYFDTQTKQRLHV